MPSPYRAAARKIVTEWGLDRPPQLHPSPLPRDVGELTGLLIRAERIAENLEFIKDVPDDLGPKYGTVSGRFEINLRLFFGPFFFALLATRPRLDPDPDERDDIDAARDQYLLPLAMVLAEGWKLFDEEQRAQVHALARERGWNSDEIKIDALLQAVILVHRDRDTLQKVKFGSHGRSEEGKPFNAFTYLKYVRWFRQSALRVAGDVISEWSDAVDPGLDTASQDLDRVEDLAPSPLDALATHGGLETLNLTPKHRQFLDALRVHLETGLSMAEAKKARASEEGITVNAIDQRLSRIKHRLAG